MTTVPLKQNMIDQLAGIHGQVVLCDELGRPVGFYQSIPVTGSAEDLDLEPPYSIDETELLRQVRTGKTLDEILQSRGQQ